MSLTDKSSPLDYLWLPVLAVLAVPFGCLVALIFAIVFVVRWADCFLRFHGDWDAKLAHDWKPKTLV